MYAGYVQSSPIFGARSRNFEEVDGLLGSLGPKQPIDLLVLPELFATGYTFVSREEAASLAEPLSGPTFEFLISLAERTGGVVVAGFPEREGERIYNSSLVVGPKGLLGSYRKIHLFNKEKLFFDPGNREPPVLSFGDFNLGIMICFDWFFPETMRVLMIKGADIVAHPSNLVLPHCQSAMKTRCLENRMFAVTANRVGSEERGEDHFTFTGESQITGPDGGVLARAPAHGSGIQVVEVDPLAARKKRINPYNDLAGDRRSELYGALLTQPESTREVL